MKTMTKEYKISTVGEDDYPELEGKTVMYIPDSLDAAAVPCVVVGCNASVGVTLVHADTKEYIMCYKGPVCPRSEDCEPGWPSEVSDEIFAAIVTGIIEGELYAGILEDILDKHGLQVGNKASSDSCAYSQ